MQLLKEIDGNEIAADVERLVKIPSPTGFTNEIKEFLVSNAKENGFDFKVTKKGAVIYSFGPKEIAGTLFAAHVDTLGGMVSSVSSDRVKIVPIGGYPALYIVGELCTVHSRNGKKYSGVFLPENPSVHVNSAISKDFKADFDNSSLRMDIDLAENSALSDLISIGDFVSLESGFRFVDGYLNSRHLDDKASAGIFIYLSKIIKENEQKLKKRVSFFFNITEETGQGIAATPQGDDLIVVDMGVVGEGRSGSEKCVAICAKDSSGPYNYDLTTQLIDEAKKREIAYKIDLFPYYGSDGSLLLRSCSDTRVALIGQGVNASHGYERTHVSGLKATAALILAHIFD